MRCNMLPYARTYMVTLTQTVSADKPITLGITALLASVARHHGLSPSPESRLALVAEISPVNDDCYIPHHQPLASPIAEGTEMLFDCLT